MPELIDIRDAFFDELYQIAKHDLAVVFITADMGAFSLERFRKDFPDRFINAGISEQNLISVAAGLALSGKKVFVYAIIPFITLRCLEQIKVDLCVMNLPVTIVGAGAGFTYSSDGPTHHAIEDVSVMRALPEMTIYNPSDQITAQVAARNAYTATGPVYVRLDKGIYPLLLRTPILPDHGMSLLKTGHRFLIISTGCMTHSAMEVSEKLAHEGIDCGILDLFRLKPLAIKLIEIVKNYQAVVTLEEHTLSGGMGSAVLEMLADSGTYLPLKRLGIADFYPGTNGDREWMRKTCSLDLDACCNMVRAFYQSVCESPVQELTLSDFAGLFNSSLDSFSDECRNLISTFDFRFQFLDGAETKDLSLQMLQKIESGKMSVAGKEKQPVWEKGWGENLEEFVSDNHSLAALKPKYYRPDSLLRINSKYAKGINPDFEYNFFKVVRLWLFDNYLTDKSNIYEFGCGPGHNLVDFAQRAPDKNLVGFDWAEASVNLLNKIAKIHGFRLSGKRFDMFNPDYSIHFDMSNALITMGALEQLGSDYSAFIQFVIQKSPDICINIEPLVELYDQTILEDYLAVLHHRKRNLLGNYLETLKEYESRGLLKILRIQRIPFGGVFEEGWSFVVWQPFKSK